MSGFVLEGLGMILRALHVIAAIAWIGESFYFVMLDRALKPPPEATPGVLGELWSVHGGGFYHKQKYQVAPARMPTELHWSKWKAYTTWLSGFALLCLTYLAAPAVYLVDPAIIAWSSHQALIAALALLLVAWIGYDLLCRMIGLRDGLLGVFVGAFVLALAYAATHLFAGRAAFLLVGAALGTIMAANVFFVIIPGQKRMVAAMARGETPDPLPGLRGRQRSVHNTYLTLPVVFAMLSVHYPSLSLHAQSWLMLGLLMLGGALIRHFFVLWHGGRRAWLWLAAAAAILIGTLAWIAPAAEPGTLPEASVTPPTPAGGTTLAFDTASVQAIVERRCAACHSAHPSLLPSAPNGVRFDDAVQIERYAEPIHRQVVALRVMPPGNLTGLTEDEREAIARWFTARVARPE